LLLAKLDYLKTHSGIEAHPQYWSTYEQTSNVKKLTVSNAGTARFLMDSIFGFYSANCNNVTALLILERLIIWLFLL
jgi:hypothetical protein